MTTLQKSIFCLSLLSLALISCKEEPKEAELQPGVVPPTQNPAFMNLDAAPAAATTQTQAPATTTSAPVATAPGMNPPHGQPGHRCEIAVGAPLNSQPTKQAASPAQQQQQATPGTFMQPAAKPAAATTTTAPGMNPPHGQPGHRCEIAVGAPLP